MEECNICITSTNQFISCFRCDQKACTKCTQHYIIENKYIGCMFCKVEWGTKFIQEHFTKAFYNGPYKKLKETLMFDLEQGFIEQTQDEIVQAGLAREWKALKKQYDAVNLPPYMIRYTRGNNLTRERVDMLAKIVEMLEELLPEQAAQVQQQETPKLRKIPCPKCPGILKSWKCDLCHCVVCSKCFLEALDEHACASEDLETAEYLKKNSKSCPNCYTSISKVDGCDQMWCTKCHVTFSWKTCKILNEKTHNPHFFEWMRQNNQLEQYNQQQRPQPQPQPCQEDWLDFRKFNQQLRAIYRNIIHTQGVELYRHNDPYNINLDTRKKYLRKSHDEQKFKILTQRNYKKHEFKMESNQVFQTYVMVARDLLQTNTDYKETISKHNELVDFLFEELENLPTRYGYKPKAKKDLERHGTDVIYMIRKI